MSHRERISEPSVRGENVRATTDLSWYDAGDVPVSRSIEVSWPGLAVSAVLTVMVFWLGLRLWRRMEAEPVAPQPPRCWFGGFLSLSVATAAELGCSAALFFLRGQQHEE